MMLQWRIWKQGMGLALLGGILLGAGTDSPTCDASCIVTIKAPTPEWRCSCRWGSPFGLGCAQQTVALPAGATMVNPELPSGSNSGAGDAIELTGGQFVVQDGQVVYTTSHVYEIGEQLDRKPYVIPYRLVDSRGDQLQAGRIAVAQINVRGK